MHLTFDWHGALRRARHGVKESADASVVPRLAWKRFPYGDRVYRYGGTALLNGSGATIEEQAAYLVEALGEGWRRYGEERAGSC